jgi:hypothetical protein
MKDKKTKPTQKSKQAKQKPKELPGCLSFGKLDLIYKFDFTEKDLEKTEEEIKQDENGSKYYNIEDFNSIKDLKFLQDKKNLWDKISLKPNNATLDQLLTANKISKKKMDIEYISYGCPKFEEEDEKFFLDIYNHLNEKNHFCINEKPLIEDGTSYSLKFEFSFKDKNHSFTIGTPSSQKENEENNKENPEENKEQENPEEKKEENNNEENNNNENKEENPEEKEPEDYEPNEAMKADKIPKFSRKDSVLCNMDPKNKKYALFYLNFDEVKDIPGNFEKNDLIELLYFLKKKGAKIFINYYKPEEFKEESNETKENAENKNEKEKPKEKSKEKKDNEEKDKEKEKEKNKDNKDKEKDKEKDAKEEKEMKCLNNLYYLTDLYFFDFKQAIEEFNKHYHCFTTDKSDKSINKQKLLDYFINGIASGTKKEVDGDKYGFFLEDFIKFYVIHANKKKAKKNEFDCQLFPKVNHNNIKLIDEYKKIIKKNANNYVSIFITFFISGITSNKSVSNEVIIGSFLNALEIIKRKVECEKNNITLNEKNLMKYKISDKNLEERIKELNLINQEDDFVLDCINKEKSELKEYVPLYDYHLIYYFRSYVNQKELKKKGFINDKGYIMYDPVHRKRMRPDIANAKLNDEEAQKKVESNIKNIDVGTRIKDKEIDSSVINKDGNLATVKKLPKSKYGIIGKKDEKGKKKGKKGKGSGSGDEASGNSSGESDEEIGNRSGSVKKEGNSNNKGNSNNNGNSNKGKNKGNNNDKNDKDYDKNGDVILLKDKLMY